MRHNLVGGGGFNSHFTVLSELPLILLHVFKQNQPNIFSSEGKSLCRVLFWFLSPPSTTLDRRLTFFCLVIIIFLIWVCLHHPGLHFPFINIRSIAWHIHGHYCVLCLSPLLCSGSTSVADLAWTINPSPYYWLTSYLWPCLRLWLCLCLGFCLGPWFYHWTQLSLCCLTRPWRNTWVSHR